MFHRGEPLTETVWEKLMLGLSKPKYSRPLGSSLQLWAGEERR